MKYCFVCEKEIDPNNLCVNLGYSDTKYIDFIKFHLDCFGPVDYPFTNHFFRFGGAIDGSSFYLLLVVSKPHEWEIIRQSDMIPCRINEKILLEHIGKDILDQIPRGNED